MRRHLLVITLIAISVPTSFSQKRSSPLSTRGAIVAFFDEDRLTGHADGQATLDDFQFFLKLIQEVARRDFPGVEFKIVTRGQLFRLPDGTGLNVQNLQPALGYVLSARGKKNRILTGVQSDADFACAASAFFRRPSATCSK